MGSAGGWIRRLVSADERVYEGSVDVALACVVIVEIIQ